MTSGISWAEMKKGNVDYNKMVKTDWLQYVMSKQVIQSDIGKFNYCDGNSLLLSAIITQYTGLSAHDYAIKYLFQPLDIQKTEWKEQNNITMGGTGLHIKSLDLAKIGLLMLHKGNINNKQIIPSQWIALSTQYQSIGYPKWFGNYGLHWWISTADINNHVNMYFALGAHGQFLFVIPERNLVVCIRKKVGKLSAMNLPKEYLFDIILPYCK
jgi:CubicO group peptidase (beta-lactamase class C family)